MKSISFLAGAGAFAAATAFLAAPGQAQDYDMDCKVILCLAGGFPQTCGDAKSYMFKRLKKGKSPFGICSYEDGGSYEAVQADAQFLHGESSYLCPDGKKLHYRRDDEDRFGSDVFCYTNSRRVRQGDDNVTIYEGKSSATHVNFTTQVTVEPGSAAAFTSPRYYVNTGNGTVIER
ncbi:hypothetical protein [Labrenzia sp. DG1229]|uniref:hypothetical protein n=1 Tax=Labrenzia sp. DG1229 TaxID=681847 RepID=UPI00068DE876|nr:hypothetical protein [Labrenzia sp. DG1229]